MTGEGIFANRSAVSAAKEQPPYSYVASVDASSADVTFAGYRICEMRCKTAGTIKLDTTESVGVSLNAADYDIFSLRIKKIYMTGTTEGIRTGAITVFGFPD
jgi:hypothetical protein